MIWGCVGPTFHDFVALNVGMEFRTFQDDSGVIDPETIRAGANLACSLALGPSNNTSGSLKTETASLETEKRVHKIHDTL